MSCKLCSVLEVKLELLKTIFDKVKNNPTTSILASFLVGILVATIPRILAYEWQKNDLKEQNRQKPSVQLIDVDLSFSVNDKVTYLSEKFKIPDFLFEGVTGNPYIYNLPELSQSIRYKDLRNYFIASHNFNMTQPANIKNMMTKYGEIYSCLESSRNIETDEIDNFFLFLTAYEEGIFKEFNDFISYSTKSEIEEYFETSALFTMFKEDQISEEIPHKLGVDLQKQLESKQKFFKYYDFINEEKIGWKIFSDNTARYYLVTFGNYKNEKEMSKYFKFFVYSIIFYDKDSLKLILDLLYKEYSDIDKISKKIIESQSVNYETMKYFSRIKTSLLYLNEGKTPITFMPNAALIIENPGVFEYEYSDGIAYKKKTLPNEITIDLAYYEFFKTISPFRLEENEGKIITMISQKQIKDMTDYQGILKAFATGSLKCRIECLPIGSALIIASDQIDFRGRSQNFD